MRDNKEITFEQKCIFCGKKFKSKSFIENICLDCLEEYSKLLIIEETNSKNNYLEEENY